LGKKLLDLVVILPIQRDKKCLHTDPNGKDMQGEMGGRGLSARLFAK
jgi:hypothetical protein